MKKIITVLTLAAVVSFASAQNPDTTKAETKKATCQAGKKCCHKGTTCTDTKAKSGKKK